MYYKTLLEKEGRLYSISYPSKFAIEYRVGEKVVGRNGSGLFLFSDFKYAERHMFTGCQIWKVTAENVRRVMRILNPNLVFSTVVNTEFKEDLFEKYWSGKLPEKYYEYALTGSLVCDSVVLVEKVM